MSSLQDEERYSRMSSLVIWFPPQWEACALCLRRWQTCLFLFSSVIYAVGGSGRYCAVSPRSCTLDGTLFDSACDTSHLVVFFSLHEHQIGPFFVGNKFVPMSMALCMPFRKTRFTLRLLQHEKNHVCAACFRLIPHRTTRRQEVS